MFTTILAAAVSFKPERWKKQENAERLEEMFLQAAKSGAKLIVAPEGMLDGYVVYEVFKKPAKRKAMVECAEPLDGPFIARFREFAARWKVCLVFGTTVKDGERDLYNTGVFIDQDGNICGTHAKTQFFEGYLPSWYFNRIGNTLRAFDTPLGRGGILICNERWNPLTTRTLTLDGARFICIPTYGYIGREQDKNILARSRENGIPIVQANVGCTLLVSKGEIVARERGFDIITLGEIDIPAPASTRNARAVEREFLSARNADLAERRESIEKQYGA